MHAIGNEPYYSESFYFDFCDAKQGIGCRVRLGSTQNQAVSWYTALVSRAGKPVVSLIDYNVPHPKPDLVMQTDKFIATHEVEEPLRRFRLTLEGEGQGLEEEAALLRGEVVGPTKISLDLMFHTSGDPYHYRVTTRSEVPCLNDGTVTVDDETYAIQQQVGQRDHSWGFHVWWDMEWCWSTIHCNDLRVHFIDRGVL